LDFSHHESEGKSIQEKLKELLLQNISDLDEKFLEQVLNL
jgi:hypothetical protein